MSSNTATARECAPAITRYAESDKPTRPLPKLTLADMMRELDAASAVDADTTLMVGPEENKRLLADAFASAQSDGDCHDDDDDAPTLLASVPVLFEPARATRPPPLRALVLTSPPSGMRPRITAEMAKAYRESQAAQAAAQRPSLMPTFKVWLPEPSAKNLVVVALWTTAITLFALLMFFATSA